MAFSNQMETFEHAEIVRRLIDLSNNDPHIAGIIDTYATIVIGANLLPHSSPDSGSLNFDAETETAVVSQRRGAYRTQLNRYTDNPGRLS